MTRAQAAAKAAKLELLARRTRHEGERDAARAALLRLAERHRLAPEDWTEPPQRAEPRRWQAPQQGPAHVWHFDPLTGEASANVKVHRYDSRTSWKIEVPPDALYGGSGRQRVAEIREAGRRRAQAQLPKR